MSQTRLRWIPRSAAVVAICFGVAVLAGWHFRIPLLRGVGYGTFVAPNTAASFILLGIALLFSAGSRLQRFLTRAIAALVGAFAFLVLLEHTFLLNFGIDHLVMSHRMDDWTLLKLPPGRYTWTTTLSFLFISTAFLLHGRRPLTQRFAEVLAGVSLLTAFLALLGRLYSAEPLYGNWTAPPTALMFFVFGLGMLAGPAHGPMMALVSSKGPGGILARRFLFVTFAVIPIIGWMRLSLYWHNIGSFELGTALMVVMVIIVLIAVIFQTSFILDRSEARRTTAVKALLEAEKLATTGRFAAQIAHEINNPLEAVTNLLYLARQSQEPERSRFLSMADQELARVAHITKQTLGFYRDDSKPLTVDCRAAVSDVVSLLKPKWVQAGIAVHNEVREGTAVVANVGELRQILSNLLVNAIEATPVGGSIRISSESAGPRAFLHIADTGQGMGQETLKRIFEPFYTTKASGTGLGLWVTQDLVRKNKGKLTVVSSPEPPRGTTFSLELASVESAAPQITSQTA